MLAVDKNIWKFLPSFYPVFPGSTCVVCGLALRIIAYSHLLEYLSMHLLEMEPLLYPAGRYFLFSQSFSSAATLLSIRSQLTAKRRRVCQREVRSCQGFLGNEVYSLFG
ncbi:hypothetical protein RLOC_00005762 [Lonchura striata]|uniref:Uncharacterized protein n=1 Tax=Lonchura striata TaxID=40157 RepID=A0A218V6G8_9PASE|nr:hypothetical protein RLOC_00005762 [Lonchura striata domestica]